ncbi:ArsR family transcriptional regulator [Streptomyces physcomitrii]|uniref:Winged helix-turn-helix transcriptional regulator n=1 Tax=Streptomyces physcomitrii TaxID=2724184 RepID=A0ABX1GYX7_9ACTN|nr:helix-turn-helix domain-containing protein [Streptomyces physcomitrii]NKI40335.1 winged helix-turn-helix transcriptional regulator [Streptomyces physcomitrii]
MGTGAAPPVPEPLGAHVIRIQLTARSLATTRFVVSPLAHLRMALDTRLAVRGAGGLPGGGEVAAVLRRHRLHRLALLRGVPGDFAWLPLTPLAFRPSLDEELHALTAARPAPASRLAAYLDGAGGGARGAGDPRRAALRHQLRAGGEEFTRGLAEEAAEFFARVLAPRWPAVAARVEAEIDLRGRIAARGGTAAMLGGLHPAVDFRAEVLRVREGRELTLRTRGPLTLCPTALGAGHLTEVGPAAAGAPVVLAYPAARRAEAAPRGFVPQAAETGPGDALGRSRVRLLKSLGEPRTTSQLADLHRLSPSTVSYHLSRLHGAGLVTRTRMGSNVYYERSVKAEVVSRRAAVTGCTPRPAAPRGG